MGMEAVTFVGGPWDGASRMWPEGIASEVVQVRTPDGVVTYHCYCAESVADPGAPPRGGPKRFVHRGQQPASE